MNINTNHSRVKKTYFNKVNSAFSDSLYQLDGTKELDIDILPVFLKTGFVGGNRTLFKNIECLPGGSEISITDKNWNTINQFRYEKLINPEKYLGISDLDLQTIGADLLIKIVDENYQTGKEVIIPISGGLDSRAILAASMQIMETSNIMTYSFGIPGSYDFEIGKMIANHLGIRHRVFDLNKLDITEDRLIRAAVLSNANTDLFQTVFLTYIFDEYGKNNEYWIGYLGGPLSGKHPVSELDIDGNIELFLKFNNYSDFDAGDSMDIIKNNLLENVDVENGHVLDQLDFYNRQERYISHQLFFDGYKFVNPLIDNRFIEFMLSLPSERRESRRFYSQMLSTQFKSLFNLPCKENFGLPLTALPIRVHLHKLMLKIRKKLQFKQKYTNNNYINYKRGISEREDLSNIIYSKIELLKKRNIIPMEIIIKAIEEYRNGKSTGMLLTLLASLEIIHEKYEL